MIEAGMDVIEILLAIAIGFCIGALLAEAWIQAKRMIAQRRRHEAEREWLNGHR